MPEEELARLEDTWRYVEHLDLLSQLIEDYLRELPQMIDHIPRRIRENTLDEERKRVYANSSATNFKAEIVVPGMHRKRTPEAMEQLSREAECERVEHYRERIH